MIFWSIAIAVTALACAALFYAAAERPVNATSPQSTNANIHFRQLLAEIDADLANGRLDETQALAARGELAREVMRANADAGQTSPGALGRPQLLFGLGAIAVTSLGLYAVLGSPDAPAMPLTGRPEIIAQNMNLDDAVAQIEQRLSQFPDDLRGWTVVAPAYVEMGRFADAVGAYRRVIALAGATPTLQTDLAEALLLQAQGAGSDEAMTLLASAAEADPALIRPRLYLAAELMRQGDYAAAAIRWREAIGQSNGDEPWLSAAQQGLTVAEAGGVDLAAQQQQEMIAGMVGGLASRLESDGGTVEEWTQLVRSYLVLGDLDLAQSAYSAAISAYPNAFDRGELDTIALGAGLTLEEETP